MISWMLWKCVSRISLAGAVLGERCRRGASRSSGVRVTTFSSTGRPPPLIRAEEVSAPLEGSIRRAPMRAEVEAHALLVAKYLLGMQTSGEGQRGQGRPSPLRRSTYGDATCMQREVCNFRQRAPSGRAATCWPRDCSLQTTAGSRRKPLPCGESRGPHVASKAKPGKRDLQGGPLELQNEEPSATTSTSSVPACGTRLYRFP